tara:strand:- start:648 stop:1052 length:405 start_codon:yes stop_codon:yes gene_type:complete
MSALRNTDAIMLLKYMVCGGLATATHLGVLALLVEVFKFNSVLASTLGFGAAIFVNYSLQYHWAFASDTPHGTALKRYLIVTLTMMGVNTFLFWLLISVFSFTYLVAQITTIGFIFGVNYVINKNFTFAGKKIE